MAGGKKSNVRQYHGTLRFQETSQLVPSFGLVWWEDTPQGWQRFLNLCLQNGIRWDGNVVREKQTQAATHKELCHTAEGLVMDGAQVTVPSHPTPLPALIRELKKAGVFSDPKASKTAETAAGPSSSPAPGPVAGPHAAPTAGPVAGPHAAPAAGPVAGPHAAPTAGPVAGPHAAPTAGPVAGPHAAPTAGPVARPHAAPAVGPVAGPHTAPALGLVTAGLQAVNPLSEEECGKRGPMDIPGEAIPAQIRCGYVPQPGEPALDLAPLVHSASQPYSSDAALLHLDHHAPPLPVLTRMPPPGPTSVSAEPIVVPHTYSAPAPTVSAPAYQGPPMAPQTTNSSLIPFIGSPMAPRPSYPHTTPGFVVDPTMVVGAGPSMEMSAGRASLPPPVETFLQEENRTLQSACDRLEAESRHMEQKIIQLETIASISPQQTANHLIPAIEKVLMDKAEELSDTLLRHIMSEVRGELDRFKVGFGKELSCLEEFPKKFDNLERVFEELKVSSGETGKCVEELLGTVIQVHEAQSKNYSAIQALQQPPLRMDDSGIAEPQGGLLDLPVHSQPSIPTPGLKDSSVPTQVQPVVPTPGAPLNHALPSTAAPPPYTAPVQTVPTQAQPSNLPQSGSPSVGNPGYAGALPHPQSTSAGLQSGGQVPGNHAPSLHAPHPYHVVVPGGVPSMGPMPSNVPPVGSHPGLIPGHPVPGSHPTHHQPAGVANQSVLGLQHAAQYYSGPTPTNVYQDVSYKTPNWTDDRDRRGDRRVDEERRESRPEDRRETRPEDRYDGDRRKTDSYDPRKNRVSKMWCVRCLSPNHQQGECRSVSQLCGFCRNRGLGNNVARGHSSAVHNETDPQRRAKILTVLPPEAFKDWFN